MILSILPKRQPDDYGSGEFGASRGDRIHNGIDYACYPGTTIFSPVDGTVTKLGYPYGDDMSYRYVQIEDSRGLNHRIFYIAPRVQVGYSVIGGLTEIGVAQDISARYTESGVMTNHVHYEIKHSHGFHNPESYNPT